ncbi:MAG: hypothetical protein ABI683_01965 [Ginsengibacter sp.]
MINKEITTIRRLLGFFIVAMFMSGLTAIPVKAELSFLLTIIPEHTQFAACLTKVLSAYSETQREYSFLLYGYDWLAFAHFILAILFTGPYRDPVKNIWVIEFGLISCVMIFPLAFIAGYCRGIPIGWQLIDCSFGVIGFVPLWICYRKINHLQNAAVI